jgi:hypothetical protein
MTLRDLVAGRLEGKSLANLLHLDVNWSQSRLFIDLGGILDRVNAKRLGQRIRGYLKVEKGELVLSLERLEAVEDNALRRLLGRIKRYGDRVQIVYREGTDVVREAIAGLPEEISTLLVENRIESN